MRAKKRFTAGLLALLLLLLCATAALAAGGVPGAVLRARDGVVRIFSYQGKIGFSGTGFALSNDSAGAVILTNYHVVDGCSAYELYYDGNGPVELEIVAVSETQDLCVLRAGRKLKGLKPLPLANGVSSGEAVYALGYPGAADELSLQMMTTKEEMTVSNGIVSAIQDAGGVGNGSRRVKLVQTNTDISHGNSGGPMLNEKGQVVGVSTLSMNDFSVSGINGAVHVDEVRSFLDVQGIRYQKGGADLLLLILVIVLALAAAALVTLFVVLRRRESRAAKAQEAARGQAFPAPQAAVPVGAPPVWSGTEPQPPQDGTARRETAAMPGPQPPMETAPAPVQNRWAAAPSGNVPPAPVQGTPAAQPPPSPAAAIPAASFTAARAPAGGYGESSMPQNVHLYTAAPPAPRAAQAAPAAVPAGPELAPAPRRRRRWVLPVVLTLSVLLLAGGGFAWYTWDAYTDLQDAWGYKNYAQVMLCYRRAPWVETWAGSEPKLYSEAMVHVENYELEEAIGLFQQLDGYADSEKQIQLAQNYLKAEGYPERSIVSKYTLFQELGNYLDSQKKVAALQQQIYKKGVAKVENEEFYDAEVYFEVLPQDYEDTGFYTILLQNYDDVIRTGDPDYCYTFAVGCQVAGMDVPYILTDTYLDEFMRGYWATSNGWWVEKIEGHYDTNIGIRGAYYFEKSGMYTERGRVVEFRFLDADHMRLIYNGYYYDMTRY